MNVTNFTLQYCKGGEKKELGIWLKCNNADLLINPLRLADSLLADEHNPVQYYDFASLDNSLDYQLKLNLSMTISQVQLIVTPFIEPIVWEWNISRKEYQQVASDSLRTFYQDMLLEKPTIYGNSIDFEKLSTIATQLKHSNLFSNVYHKTINDVKIEKFSLAFLGYDDCDISYVGQIGDRKLESYLSDWSNDFDKLRYQMEGLLFLENQTDIKICYEDEPTIFRFKKANILTDMEKVGNGISFHYKKLMKVEIHPNGFERSPIIIGYCEYEETIRTMYEALMNLGYIFATSPHYNSLSWNYSCGLTIYNTLKSGIIENHLCPNRVKAEVVKRQTVVNHIITICCDKERLGFFENGESIYTINNRKDLVYISGLKDVVVKGINNWQNQMLEADENFDWAKWDETGMKFAQELRYRIPDDYDIWYQTRNGERRLLLNDPIYEKTNDLQSPLTALL